MPWFHVQWVTFLSHPIIICRNFCYTSPYHLQPVQTDNLEIFSVEWLDRSVSTWTIYELTHGTYRVLQRDRENLGESRFRQERKTAKNYRLWFQWWNREGKGSNFSTHILVFRHDCTDKSQIQWDVWFQRPPLFQPVYCHSCRFVLFYQNRRAGCDVFSEQQWRWCRACSLLRASCTIHGQPGARESAPVNKIKYQNFFHPLIVQKNGHFLDNNLKRHKQEKKIMLPI